MIQSDRTSPTAFLAFALSPSETHSFITTLVLISPMLALPLELRTLIIGEVRDLDEVERLSMCSRAWRDAAAPRLFRTVKLGSSHTHALLARMSRFAPRHGHLVRSLALDLSFASHAGHRGFVDFAQENAHVALATALATVIRTLPNITDVSFTFHGRGDNVPAASYAPLFSALASLRRWSSLSISCAYTLGSAPLADALLACAAPRVVSVTVHTPHSIQSLSHIIRHGPFPKLQRLKCSLWRSNRSLVAPAEQSADRTAVSFDQTVQGVAVHIDCCEEDTPLFSAFPRFSKIAPGGLELAESSVRPMETM